MASAFVVLIGFGATSVVALVHCSGTPAKATGGKENPVVDAGGLAPCDSTHKCSGGLSCCAKLCTDTAHDPRNCGACGVACTASQFCTGTKCDNAIFSNLCANPKATVDLGQFPPDNAAGVALGAALATSCSPAVSIGQASQMSGILGDAGQPSTGVGDTLIVGGGSFGQIAVQYLDQAGLSPIYLKTDGTTAQYVLRATGAPIFASPVMVSDLTAHHDYFFIELAVEPQSGTLCFVGAGILAPGTAAAGYYGSAQLIPNRAADMHSWEAVEWTDAPGDGGTAGEGGVDLGDGIPNAGDTFRVVASGP
jgi:hypothetical protein